MLGDHGDLKPYKRKTKCNITRITTHENNDYITQIILCDGRIIGHTTTSKEQLKKYYRGN